MEDFRKFGTLSLERTEFYINHAVPLKNGIVLIDIVVDGITICNIKTKEFLPVPYLGPGKIIWASAYIETVPIWTENGPIEQLRLSSLRLDLDQLTPNEREDFLKGKRIYLKRQ